MNDPELLVLGFSAVKDSERSVSSASTSLFPGGEEMLIGKGTS